MEFLNTDERLFLVKFAFTSTGGQIIVTQNSLIDAIKELKPQYRGIEYIKEFDVLKGTFKHVTKNRLRKYFSWNHEVTEEIKKILELF